MQYPHGSRRRIRTAAAVAATAAFLCPTAVGCSGGTTSAAGEAAASPHPGPSHAPSTDGAFKALEGEFHARLGVYAVDTGSGRSVGYRSGERFNYASTSKVLITAAVLRTHTDARMRTVVTYGKDDLLDYAPVTRKHVDTGMTIGQLCDAALRYSDNTAANLLFASVGGPKGVAASVARDGDHVTRIEDTEPKLNDWHPGAVGNTSTPHQLATDLRLYALGTALDASDRAQLVHWMRTNTTGDTTIRAGVPKSWTVADKTGGADYGIRNDIAVLQPPHHAPIVVAILSNGRKPSSTYDDRLVARAATVVADTLG